MAIWALAEPLDPWPRLFISGENGPQSETDPSIRLDPASIREIGFDLAVTDATLFATADNYLASEDCVWIVIENLRREMYRLPAAAQALRLPEMISPGS